MTILSGAAQRLAGVVALAGWVGLAVQLDASSAMTGSAGAAIWAMLRYFTVITNLVQAVVLTSVALGRPRCGMPFLLGGVALSIALVGVIYSLLLRGLVELSGGAKIADFLLHDVTPFLGVLFWLAYVPKGALRPRDPWLWTLFPLAYFAYALVRGKAEGTYAYPFIDVAVLGWVRAGLNGAVIALGFILAGHAVLWMDARLARRVGTS